MTGAACSAILLLLPNRAKVGTAVCVKVLAGVLHAFPAVVTLLSWGLEPLAVHAESCCACEGLACIPAACSAWWPLGPSAQLRSLTAGH